MRLAVAFPALPLLPVLAGAQQIPGRDLFDFPIGSVAEAGASSLATGDGLRNPASLLLSGGERWRLSVSSLLTGTHQSVSGQVAAVATAWRGATYGLSVARASVSGIARTETDPQSIGMDVPYNALVVSAIAARRHSRDLSGGVALRWLRGELDDMTRNELGIDAGLLAEHLTHRDGRIAVSSFFWRPGSHSGDGASFSGSLDMRALGTVPLREQRVGYAFTSTPGISSENYAFTSARWGVVEARTGLAHTRAYSHGTVRWRLALGVHVDRYFAAIAREDSPSGLAASYQFTLTSVLPSR